MEKNSNGRTHGNEHSEKVRKILDNIPYSLEIIGFVVMALIFISLVLVFCLVPYPHSDGESILRHLMRT